MNKYPVFIWTVKSIWLSGAETYDKVCIALPDLQLAKNFIFNHLQRFFPITDVRLRTTVNLLHVINNEETLPAAHRFHDERLWQKDDVSDLYPEILAYWMLNGFTNIKIVPCAPVDEDCLYLNDKWYSYCRHPYEWMQREDLCDTLKPPVGKRNRRNCTV